MGIAIIREELDIRRSYAEGEERKENIYRRRGKIGKKGRMRRSGYISEVMLFGRGGKAAKRNSKKVKEFGGHGSEDRSKRKDTKGGRGRNNNKERKKEGDGWRGSSGRGKVMERQVRDVKLERRTDKHTNKTNR